jgi:hypothetical protein
MTYRNDERNGMASTKTAIKLQIESIARAKAEEKLKALADAESAVEREAQAQVERKLRRQQERYGALVERIETQAKEEIAKVNAQLQELLERINSCKAELDLKEESLNEAQGQLEAETAAKVKAYENLRIERRLRRQTEAKLTEDTVKVRVELRPVRIREYRRTAIQSVEVINDFRPRHQSIFRTRHVKRKIALVSALAIISAIILVLSVAKDPSAGEGGYEMAGGQAQPTNLMGSSVNIEKPTDDKAAGLFGASIAGPAAGTTNRPALKSNDEGDVELKVNDEKGITDLDEPPAIAANPPPLKIITSANSHIVQSSDDNRWETNVGSYITYSFSEVVIPAEATIKSVVVFIEHFEEERFAEGKLEWGVGTGWPNEPEVWATIKAPLNKGESNENFDTWDVTSVVDTAEKIKSLQLHVKNNSYSYKSKTLMDYAYVIVEYD